MEVEVIAIARIGPLLTTWLSRVSRVHFLASVLTGTYHTHIHTYSLSFSLLATSAIRRSTSAHFKSNETKLKLATKRKKAHRRRRLFAIFRHRDAFAATSTPDTTFTRAITGSPPDRIAYTYILFDGLRKSLGDRTRDRGPPEIRGARVQCFLPRNSAKLLARVTHFTLGFDFGATYARYLRTASFSLSFLSPLVSGEVAASVLVIVTWVFRDATA